MGVRPSLALVGTIIRLFVLQHDAGHQSLFTRRRVNDLAGTCLSFLTGVSYEAWKTEHAWHHNHQGKLSHRGVDRMNSLMTAAEAREGPDAARLRARKISAHSVFFLGAVSLLILRKVSGGYFQFRPNFRWPFYGRVRMRRGVLLTNIGHLALHLAGFAALGGRWLLVLLALWIAGGLGASLFWSAAQF